MSDRKLEQAMKAFNKAISKVLIRSMRRCTGWFSMSFMA